MCDCEDFVSSHLEGMSLTYIALLQISASIGQRIEFTLYRFTLEETKKKTTNREDNFPCDNNIIIKDGSKHHMVSFLKREKSRLWRGSAFCLEWCDFFTNLKFK